MFSSDDRMTPLPETTPSGPSTEPYSAETALPATLQGTSAGRRAGPFLLLDEVSPTAQDTVLQARDERLGRVLRIRVLRLPTASDPTSRAAFACEIRSLSGVSHPHLASGVLGADLDAVEPYVGLAEPPGAPLSGFGPRSRGEARREVLYPNRRLAEAMLHGAEALGSLHAAGLIHGNLRPDVFRVSADGTVLLTGPGEPAASVPEGAPYASPADWDGGGRERDLYALAASFFALVTGRPPPVSRNIPLLAKADNPGLAGALAHAIDRCLARDPGNRYVDAAALAADLRGYLEVEVMPVPVVRRLLPLLIEGMPVFVVGAALVLLAGRLAGYRPGKFMTLPEALALWAPSLVYWFVMDAALGGSWLRRRWGIVLADRGGDPPHRGQFSMRAAIKAGILSLMGTIECTVIVILAWLADDGKGGFLGGLLFLLILPVAALFVVLMVAGLLDLRFPELRASNFDMQGASSSGLHPLHDQWAGTRLVLRRQTAAAGDLHAVVAWDIEASTPLARLGPYDLVRRLGAGTMGTVFLAWDRALGRPAAVKVISLGPEQCESRKRFEREARLAAQLSHPNVASVFETGGWDSEPYIAMEFIDGESLQAMVERQGPLQVAEAWDYVVQIAEGLQAADRAGVVHRDVKPANAIINRAGVVKVTDFGVSRSPQPGDQALTHPGSVVGTPSYMPPEQARGERVDRRSDMYALGMTLYYLLTGRTAFAARSREDLLALQLTTCPEPLLGKVPGLNAAQDALVRRLLARNPQQRFPDYETLLEEFREEAPERLAPVSALLRLTDGLFFSLMGASVAVNPLVIWGAGQSLASGGTATFGASIQILSNPFYLLGCQAVVVAIGAACLVLRPGFPRRPQPGPAGRWAWALRGMLTQLIACLLIFWPVFHRGSGLRVARIGGRRIGIGRSLVRILVNFPMLLPVPAVALLAGVPQETCFNIVLGVSLVVGAVNALLLVRCPRRLLGDLVVGTEEERILPAAVLQPAVTSKPRSAWPGIVAAVIGLALIAWMIHGLVQAKNRRAHEVEQTQTILTQEALRFIGRHLRRVDQLIRQTHPNAPPEELLQLRQQGAAMLRSFEGKNLISAPRFPDASLIFAWEAAPTMDWPLGRPEAPLAFEPRPDEQGGRYVLMGDGETVRYLPEEEFQRLLGR